MTPKAPRIGAHLQEWITARQRHHLSHAHVQMARELGMNSRKLGKLDNGDQEPWKLPLPAFIESLYLHQGARSSSGTEKDGSARGKALEHGEAS